MHPRQPSISSMHKEKGPQVIKQYNSFRNSMVTTRALKMAKAENGHALLKLILKNNYWRPSCQYFQDLHVNISMFPSIRCKLVGWESLIKRSHMSSAKIKEFSILTYVQCYLCKTQILACDESGSFMIIKSNQGNSNMDQYNSPLVNKFKRRQLQQSKVEGLGFIRYHKLLPNRMILFNSLQLLQSQCTTCTSTHSLSFNEHI